ncbi:MAG: hypothetical protein JOY78_10115 [Pseudonocardia sp.]|nr:hypothetical protein [Pseudonocardia sp.]
MVEDVLEQVVDDWLRREGYFTRTNVRFGPRKHEPDFIAKEHNQQSDLDVLAVKPPATGPDRVWAVSCKAMQAGFSPNRWLAAADADRVYNGKAARKHLRELWDPVWNASLRARVRELTGAESFTYVLAVTRLGPSGTSDVSSLLDHEVVGSNLRGLAMRVLTFGQLWGELQAYVNEQIEPSHVGRLAQLLRASQLDPKPSNW